MSMYAKANVTRLELSRLRVTLCMRVGRTRGVAHALAASALRRPPGQRERRLGGRGWQRSHT